MKAPTSILSFSIGALLAGSAFAQTQGPSTGSTPYATPIAAGVSTFSVVTVDNTGATPDDIFTNLTTGTPNSYRMAGIPDGLGAFDNGNDTFTVVMNHEIGNTNGVVRAHGSIGAFVSKWIINKNTLAVVGGADLSQTVKLWNGTSYSTATTAWGRFCSADLPEVSAFSFGALGTTARIFMNGEENGDEGRAFGHIITGPEAGTTYQLPRLGKFSWENSVANPFPQAKTVLIGTDDTTPGQVYLYVGTKTSTGSEVDKAGLTNGLLYGIKVPGFATEARTGPFGGMVKGGTVPFVAQIKNTTGDVSNLTGAQLQADSAALGVTEFLRPEDAAWDTKNPNRLYFATTDRVDQVKDGNPTGQVGRSRLWVLEFTNITNPTAGGVLRLLIDGSETVANGGLNMMDNIGVDRDGNVGIVEDVGGDAHNGLFARYNVATGAVEFLARHDVSRFGNIGVGATAPFNNNEEFSGNIDITHIMGTDATAGGSALNTARGNSPLSRWYLLVDQAHYTSGATTEQVEGGQLILVAANAATNPINNAASTRSGAVRDRLTGKYLQTVTITNNTSAPLAGPFYVAVDNLTSGVSLSNTSGSTVNVLPLGSSYILVPNSGSGLGAGASLSVTLQFNNPSNGAINYYPRILNGIVAP